MDCIIFFKQSPEGNLPNPGRCKKTKTAIISKTRMEKNMSIEAWKQFYYFKVEDN